MSNRRAPTLRDFVADAGGADALDAVGHPLARRIRHHAGPQPAEPKFRCRCGRVVDTDMMMDLSPDDVPEALRLTDAERAACGFAHDRYRCDGCWTAALHRGAITSARLREAVGQPEPQEGQRW